MRRSNLRSRPFVAPSSSEPKLERAWARCALTCASSYESKYDTDGYQWSTEQQKFSPDKEYVQYWQVAASAVPAGIVFIQ